MLYTVPVKTMVGLENKINTLMTYLTTTHDMPWKQNKYFNVVHCISVKNMVDLENKKNI
jgi:hypothetical protein